MLTNRRTLLQRISGLPLLSVLSRGDLLAQGSDATSEESEKFEQKYLAVRTLRLINTAQAWHRQDTGYDADIATLWQSEAIRELQKDPRMEAAKMGSSLLAQLRFDENEILPGWKLKFEVSYDHLGYVVVFNSSTSDLDVAFSSDERGRIYEGKPLARLQSPPARANEAIGRACPIGGSTGGRFHAFIRTVAFGGQVDQICAKKCPNQCVACCPQGFACCCDSCCTCTSNCFTCSRGCINCGCSCVWCCCF